MWTVAMPTEHTEWYLSQRKCCFYGNMRIEPLTEQDFRCLAMFSQVDVGHYHVISDSLYAYNYFALYKLPHE